MKSKINTEISVNEELLIESNKKYGFDMEAEMKKLFKEHEKKKAKKMADSYKKDANKDTKSQGRSL